MIEPLPKKLHDFRAFLWLTWQHLNLPEPTPIQYEIASYLQYGPRREIIEAFRGVGKSWITSTFVVWSLRMNPQLNFLVVSASKARADDFSTFTLRLINDMPVLRCLIPKDKQRCSKIAFDVAPAEADHAPSVKSVGILGQLAGSRADIIVADDIEIPNNSMTQQLRDRLSEAVKEFDAIIKPGGRIIYLGTPQTEQSLYNLLPERGYSTRIWPALFPPRSLLEYYGHRLAPSIIQKAQSMVAVEGTPTDPKRFSSLDLQERAASYGRSGFALQFMLDTSIADADRHPLKLRDLIVMSVDAETAPERVIWTADADKEITDLPCVGMQGDKYFMPRCLQGDWIPYTASVMVIDPSGRGKDETSYAVGKSLNGQIFVTEAGGWAGGYEEATLQGLVKVAKRNKVNMVLIEANFGDGMFKALIEPYFVKDYPVTIEEVRHHTQKEKRIIDTLEPVMNQHKLIIARSVIEKDFESAKHLPPDKALKYQLMYQMSHITQERNSLGHDDRLDALAMLVAEFTKQMNTNVEAAMRHRKESLLLDELKVFMGHGGKHTGGLSVTLGITEQRPTSKTWVNVRGRD